MIRGLVAALLAWCAASTDVAVQTDTMELLEPKLGGVALQLKELEAMKERGTLNDLTFAHAVHETTVLGPLTASLAAMGVLHDKGQLSDEELAFAKSVAFARYDRDESGNVIAPGDSNPSTKPANVKLATADDKRREAEEMAEKRREATKLAMAAAEEKAKKEEERRAAEKARRDEERAAKKAAEAAVFERKAAEAAAAAAAADAAADAEAAAALRKAEQGRVEEAEKIAAEAQAYADEAKRAGNAEAAAEAETIAQEARAAVAEAREAAAEPESIVLDTKPAAPEPEPEPEPEPTADADDAAAAAFMAQAAAEKAAFDEAAKQEAAEIAAREAKAKAALEPLAKAREAARAATCEGWHQTGRCTPDGPRESHSDRSCDDDVPAGASGYCQCGDGQAAKSDCDHASFKCQAMCAARQAYMKDGDVCEGWRQTGGCSPHGPREAGSDRGCSEEVPAGSSGYCECHDGTRARESDCDHGIFTCGEACAVHLGLAYPDG
jgi:hypothetical protein